MNFDPFDDAAVETLRNILDKDSEREAVVYTYSDCGLSWLENLTAQHGAFGHFRTLPSAAEL